MPEKLQITITAAIKQYLEDFVMKLFRKHQKEVSVNVFRELQGQPFLTKKLACQHFGMGRTTLDTRLKGIEEESTRYPYGVIRDGGIVLVNYFAMTDYLFYRNQLQQKNLRKHIPPFSARKTAEAVGFYNVVKEG